MLNGMQWVVLGVVVLAVLFFALTAATRLHGETTSPWFALDNLQLRVTTVHTPVGQCLATVRSIRPDPREPRHEVLEPSQELAGADRVVYIR